MRPQGSQEILLTSITLLTITQVKPSSQPGCRRKGTASHGLQVHIAVKVRTWCRVSPRNRTLPRADSVAQILGARVVKMTLKAHPAAAAPSWLGLIHGRECLTRATLA